MTHEPELTSPVDLCTSDGASLNPKARGWSRHPLHRANLDGAFGDNKRWDYWAVLSDHLVISCVYSDIDHFGLADVWWADLVGGQSGGASILVEPGALAIPEISGTRPLHLDRNGLKLTVEDAPGMTRLRAWWTEDDSRPGSFDVAVARPTDHESVNVVIPWDDMLFNFTSKEQALPAEGTLEVGDRSWSFGGPRGTDAWGVLDVGRGRWPHEISWNWGGGAGRSGEHVISLQFGGKWTDGTGFTENGILVDGRLSKLGRELTWDYLWSDPMRTWTVTDPGGQLDAVLTPRFDKHTDVGEVEEFGSQVHQVFGTWSGHLTTDAGIHLEFDGLLGFAEEARQRW